MLSQKTISAVTATLVLLTLVVAGSFQPAASAFQQCEKNGLYYDPGACLSFADVDCCEENHMKSCEDGSWGACGSCGPGSGGNQR